MDDGHDIAPRTDAQQLLRVWLSPSFPVGAYAYSHGLEAAVARGLVENRANLEAWLRALLQHGSVRTDLVLLAAAWRAVLDVCDLATTSKSQPPIPQYAPHGAVEIAEINALALALQPSAERYLETSQQGGSFVTAINAVWPCASMEMLRAACPDAIAYPVALGIAAAGHEIGLTNLLDAYALAFVQNLASAAIRLSVIGQTDAQRVIATVYYYRTVQAGPI